MELADRRPPPAPSHPQSRHHDAPHRGRPKLPEPKRSQAAAPADREPSTWPRLPRLVPSPQQPAGTEAGNRQKPVPCKPVGSGGSQLGPSSSAQRPADQPPNQGLSMGYGLWQLCCHTATPMEATPIPPVHPSSLQGRALHPTAYYCITFFGTDTGAAASFFGFFYLTAKKGDIAASPALSPRPRSSPVKPKQVVAPHLTVRRRAGVRPIGGRRGTGQWGPTRVPPIPASLPAHGRGNDASD